MKRTVLMLVVLFAATTLFAGGKECETKHAKKSVQLTGTILKVAAEDGDKYYFRVGNDGEKYSICDKSKVSAVKLAKEGNATLSIKGQLVSCTDGQELMIEEVKKV